MHGQQALAGLWLQRSAEPDHAPDAADRVGDPVDADRVVATLASSLRTMSRTQRDVLLVYAWADLTYEQIADALGVPVGTVRSRLNRARAASAWGQRCFTPPPNPKPGGPDGRADTVAQNPRGRRRTRPSNVGDARAQLTERVKIGPRSAQRRSRPVLGVAAAAVVAPVAAIGLWPGTAPPATAATLLHHTAKAVGGAMGRTVSTMYIPYDRDAVWVNRSWCEPTVQVFGGARMRAFAAREYPEASHADDPYVERPRREFRGTVRLAGDETSRRTWPRSRVIPPICFATCRTLTSPPTPRAGR